MAGQIQLRKAKRSSAKIKIGMIGASGSGKTLSSLMLAYGFLKAEYPGLSDGDIWEKICIIDTENGSGSLYVGNNSGDVRVGEYLTIPLSPPYSPQRYEEAIDCAESGGIEVLIIDSLSHAWAGEGGLLDIHGTVSAKTLNSYTAWRNVTPQHNRLVDKILQCKMHVIATLRTKTDYVIEEDEKGKKVPKKIGLAPIFRDGLEYEFTTVFEIDQNHNAVVSKDRTGAFDSLHSVLTSAHGRRFWEWISEGAPKKVEIRKAQEDALDVEQEVPTYNDEITQERLTEFVNNLVASMTNDEKRATGAKIREITNSSYKDVPDPAVRRRIYEELGGK